MHVYILAGVSPLIKIISKQNQTLDLEGCMGGREGKGAWKSVAVNVSLLSGVGSHLIKLSLTLPF